MKDTNPDHYKVDNADFIAYMDDPKIKGFGDWMFANGFNMGAMEAWISVNERMPAEHETIFAQFKGTDRWRKFMYERASDDVRIVEEFEDGTRRVSHSYTIDGEWETEKKPLKRKVTHWIPNPDLPCTERMKSEAQ